MRNLKKFLPSAILLIFIDFSTVFLGNLDQINNNKYSGFSLNKFCREISFSQSQKNQCLINFGFKVPTLDPVRIAVFDSGIDKDHSLLRTYVSDQGYDASSDLFFSPFLDNIGHGTHVSGIIVQQIEEISDFYKTVIPIEIISAKFTADLMFSPNSLPKFLKLLTKYEKFDIINISASGFDFNQDEYYAIFEAFGKNTQVVVAAGNNSSNLNEDPTVFPCSYKLPNIICVGNSENDLFFNPSSNYGNHFVDVSTNGTNVFSSLPNERWGFLSGTSMSTPKVSALVAFIRTQNGSQLIEKNKLSQLTKRTPASNGKSKYGEIDFFKYNNLMIGRLYE